MKNLTVVSKVLVFCLIDVLSAGETVLPYSSFGPQVIAHELLGKEWWQWESQGGSKSGVKDYDIKVVVYWDEKIASVRERYPIDPSRERDFRYVDLSKAIAYLRRTISEFEDDQSIDLKILRKTLATLSKISPAPSE